MPLNARGFAFDVLDAVEHGGFADDLLRAKAIDPQDIADAIAHLRTDC